MSLALRQTGMAGDAYAKMMAGDARFRMVLTVD